MDNLWTKEIAKLKKALEAIEVESRVAGHKYIHNLAQTALKSGPQSQGVPNDTI